MTWLTQGDDVNDRGDDVGTDPEALGAGPESFCWWLFGSKDIQSIAKDPNQDVPSTFESEKVCRSLLAFVQNLFSSKQSKRFHIFQPHIRCLQHERKHIALGVDTQSLCT